MKKFMKEFWLRGLVSAGGGPLVLAIIYGILGATDVISSLTPKEVCIGILSLTVLALFAGGMTAIYQQEQLPLVFAILIHGAGLYIAYILIYLLNGWLQRQLIPILVFTAIFIAGYALIWLLIFLLTKAKADRLNQKLQKQS